MKMSLVPAGGWRLRDVLKHLHVFKTFGEILMISFQIYATRVTISSPQIPSLHSVFVCELIRFAPLNLWSLIP